MSKKAQPSLQASDAFAITPSDSGSILTDAGNVEGYKFCYVHCGGNAGVVRVTPVDKDLSSYVDIYLPQGGTTSLMVRKIWSTTTAATGLVAFIGRGGTF